MPDTPVAGQHGAPYDPGLERRVIRLEDEMRDVKSVLGQIVPMLVRIQATLDSALPHLATKAELGELRGEIRAELAEKPGKAYLWGVLCVLIAAMTASYGAGLAAIALLR